MIKEVKYNHTLEWKSFNVQLDDVEAWARMECGPDYCGMSANSKLELHFTEVPSQLILDKIQAMWDRVTEEEETAKIAHRAQVARAIAYAKENLPYADFASLLPAEKKLWMNSPLSPSDKEAIAAKYPNV